MMGENGNMVKTSLNRAGGGGRGEGCCVLRRCQPVIHTRIGLGDGIESREGVPGPGE